MNILTIASYCGALVTIAGFMYGLYKFARGFEKRFDDIDNRLKDTVENRHKEINALNSEVLVMYNQAIDSVNENLAATEKTFNKLNAQVDKLNSKIDADELLTLKLALTSPYIPESEKLQYAQRYRDLGGNGAINRMLLQLEEKEAERLLHIGDEVIEDN